MIAYEFPEECPFWERHVTLGRVRNGILEFAYNKGDKWDIVKDRFPSDVFFVAWTGEYRTDIFKITNSDFDKLVIERYGKDTADKLGYKFSEAL